MTWHSGIVVAAVFTLGALLGLASSSVFVRKPAGPSDRWRPGSARPRSGRSARKRATAPVIASAGSRPVLQWWGAAITERSTGP